MKVTIVVEVPELQQEIAEWERVGNEDRKTITGFESVPNPFLSDSQTEVSDDTRARIVADLAYLGSVEEITVA